MTMRTEQRHRPDDADAGGRLSAIGRATRLVLIPATYLLGLVVLSGGVGLAVPRLGAQDSGVTLWFGAVAGTCGAVTVTWSVRRMLRGARRRRWLLLVPALVITVYLALWTVGQAVAASFPAHPELGSRTPADVGLRHESVVLRTSDGADLAAWWVPSRNGAAVALLHGAGSTRTAVLDQAALLGSHGYGVLLLDARGHGGSGGRGMDFGWYGEQDLDAAVDFLTRQPGVAPDRIGVVGLSMGGETAIGAAGADPRVRAVVAEGATHRVAADKDYLAAYGLRGNIQRRIDWATFAVADLLSTAPRPEPLRESVRDAQADGTLTPMLLITAGDVHTERLAADLLHQAAPEAVEVWTVPGAGHTDGLRTDPAEWRSRVLSFLDGALTGATDAP